MTALGTALLLTRTSSHLLIDVSVSFWVNNWFQFISISDAGADKLRCSRGLNAKVSFGGQSSFLNRVCTDVVPLKAVSDKAFTKLNSKRHLENILLDG